MLWRQVQKEAVAKEYANARYQQPYQTAMYETAVLLEAQRWHTHEYEAVIGKLQPGDLTVGDPLSLPSRFRVASEPGMPLRFQMF